jgi:hypothetical protein
LKITISNGSTSQTVTPETIDTITYFPPKEQVEIHYSYQIQVEIAPDTFQIYRYKLHPPITDEKFNKGDMMHALATVAARHT